MSLQVERLNLDGARDAAKEAARGPSELPTPVGLGFRVWGELPTPVRLLPPKATEPAPLALNPKP